MFDEKERKSELKKVREELSNMDREEGARKRPAVTMIAVVMVVWMVLCLINLGMGLGHFAGITALMLAAFTGLCWGTFRESHDRSIATYTVVSAIAAVLLIVAHCFGF